MALRSLSLVAALCLAFTLSPLTESAAAVCLIPPAGGSCPIPVCLAGSLIEASAVGEGTVSAECGGASCSASGINPACDFTALVDDLDGGTCAWAGVGYAHCEWP